MNTEQVFKIFLVAATKFYFQRPFLLWQINPQNPMNPAKIMKVLKKKKIRNIVQWGWEVPAVGHVKWLRVHEILLSQNAHKK